MNHWYSLYRRSLSVVVNDSVTSWFCCCGRSPVLPWARYQGHDTDSIQPLFPSDSWLKFHAWTVSNGSWCTHRIRRNGWILIWHHLHVKVGVKSKLGYWTLTLKVTKNLEKTILNLYRITWFYLKCLKHSSFVLLMPMKQKTCALNMGMKTCFGLLSNGQNKSLKTSWTLASFFLHRSLCVVR